MQKCYTIWQGPLCDIVIVAANEGLIHLHLQTGHARQPFVLQPDWQFASEAPLLQQTISQLEEYFSGRRMAFSLPLSPIGTAFQHLTWKALQDIPYGETRSYQQVARQIGSPKAARAVGTANGKNPLPLLIPCHRVIAASGKLAGFAAGVEIKQKLLELEAGTLSRLSNKRLS